MNRNPIEYSIYLNISIILALPSIKGLIIHIKYIMAKLLQNKTALRCIVALSAMILLSNYSLANQLLRFEETHFHMGTKFRIVIYADQEKHVNTAFEKAFLRIAEIEAICSDYQANSEVSRLSQASPTNSPIKVSDDLYCVLHQSQLIAVQTAGAFDVTIGPLTKVWRRIRRQKKLDLMRLSAAAQSVRYTNLKLHSQQQAVSLLKPNMRIDLGGIAKGYAADEAYKVLKQHQLPIAMIDAGGDLVLGDAPPNKKGWSVSIAKLETNKQMSLPYVLANCAVATSGDLYQYVEIEGIRYSHIIDPRTSRPITRKSSVTVIAPTGTLADAWASAVSVLGPDTTQDKLPKDQSIAALIYYEKDGEVIKQKSHNWHATIEQFSKSD